MIRWAFRDFAAQLDWQSSLLRDRPNSPHPQREALLHLVFPDTFEPIVSTNHKRLITEEYDRFITEPTDDVDRKLAQIRRGLETERGRDIHFYDDEIRIIWDLPPDIATRIDAYLQQAQEELVDSGELDDREGYKLAIGEKLAAARQAVLNDTDDWARLVKSGISGNLIFSVTQAKFRGWLDQSPAQALMALQALWTDDDSSVFQRIRAFGNLLPRSDISGPGTRMNVASVLLMGLDVEQYPPLKKESFGKAYERTGYPNPPQGADEEALYEHALGFLDQLIKRNTGRPDNRLDAQGIVWLMQYQTAPLSPDVNGADGGEEPEEDEPPPPEPPSLEKLAHELMLDGAFLSRIEALLDDKGQVIFRGRRGRGRRSWRRSWRRAWPGRRSGCG